MEATGMNHMLRTLVLVVLLSAIVPFNPGPAGAQDGEPGRTIRNPYFEKTEWKVWRDDVSPVDVQSLVREGKEKKVAEATLVAPDEGKRVYPTRPEGAGRYLTFAVTATASREHAGIWDDVYTSWSGLHGYVRNRWKDPQGNAAEVLNHIIHFVDVTKGNTLRAGVNFIHQSTTGCAHAITNGYVSQRTEQFERLYFADALFCGPAHASYTEQRADRTNDLYMALFPAIFNSVGSSNSETMAITKMIIAGGFLPPETKRKLKRNGLYPSAMLYIWKAALPYPVPYDHELRHRLAYKAVGDRSAYPEKYGAAGIDRGDLNLAYHCYDDAAHMRNMVALAEGMKSTPPEAILKGVGIEGGRTVYSLKKAMLVVQEKGEDVGIDVSTEDCYDLDDRPLTSRWKLLCGNRNTTVEHLEGNRYRIRVPWDDALPQGRTSVALFVNNGIYDGNPAVVNIYRKKGAIPGNGMGPKDYAYPADHANLRPVVLGLTDRVVKPGETVRIPIRVLDPEGFPVRVQKRAGEVGELDGNLLTWKCPSDSKPGTHPVTVIASDGTSGDSYAGETLHFEIAPKVFAGLSIESPTGPAPFTIEAVADRCIGDKLEYGWEFYAPALKRKAKAFKDLVHGAKAKHIFTKPGLYELKLTVKGAAGTDTEIVSVLVTDGSRKERPAGISVEGNDVNIPAGDTTPQAFDHTHFGVVAEGAEVVREYLLINAGDEGLTLDRRTSVTVSGPQGREFELVLQPRREIGGRGSSRFRIRFRPAGAGERRAVVTIGAKGSAFTFTVGATGDVDQEALDRAAAPVFAAAKKLFDEERWEAAEKKLRAFLAKWPGATASAEARDMIAKIETDPAIREAIRAAAEGRAKAADAEKRERAARSIWKMAESFRKNGREDLARKNLERLVRDYPDTSWGKKAKEALSK